MTPRQNPLAILQTLSKALDPKSLAMVPGVGAVDPAVTAAALKDYMVDAAERSVF